MDKRLANDIISSFDMKTMQVLEAYVTYRSEVIHNQMDTVSDSDQWRKLQGSIQELKTLLKIRDYAVQVKDSNND